MEKQCKWHFADRAANDQWSGPNNSTTENFKGSGGQIHSLIREVIQNSLDARISFEAPVRVKFNYCVMIPKCFPQLLQLEGTLNACKNFYPENPQAQIVYEEMLAKLANFKASNRITCLRIDDSGTKGMDYVPVASDIQHNSKFLAFMRSLGIHSEQENGGGGSFGFGKAAYFGLSPLATVLTSTCTQGEDGEFKYYFEGSSWLSTHYYDNGTIRQFKSNVGYYDNNNGEPIWEYERIPVFFQRKEGETGTSFFILGAEPNDDTYEQMRNSVLENFWLAIYRNELEVEIGDGAERYLITSETLKEQIDFVEQFDRIRNPKRYYEAVSDAANTLHKKHDLKNYGFVDAMGNSYGTVDIYLKKDPEGLNKFSRLRRLLMGVEYKDGKDKDGYNGVTVVSEGAANMLLKETEPPAHDHWYSNRLEAYSTMRTNARKLLETITKLENEAVAELFDHQSRSRDTITDIHDYCAIVDERTKHEHQPGKDANGSVSTALEKGYMSKKKLVTEGYALETITSNSEPEHGGRLRGGSNPERKPKNPGPKPGVHKHPDGTGNGYNPSQNGKERRLYDPKKVKVHCVARADGDNKITHELLITAKEESIEDAALILKVVGVARNEALHVVQTDKGTISNHYPNMIENVKLKKGLNRIGVVFEDSTKKYAISLTIKN